MNLPVALFIECNDNFVQCCHGGIEPNYSPKAFLDKDNSTKLFQNVGMESKCAGLFWSDFCANDASDKSHSRGLGVKFDQTATLKYLNDNNLKAIMRAHMDMEFGLKIFLDPSKGNACEQTIQTTNYSQECLYHWIEAAKKLKITDNKFSLSTFDYYPVFTFTSAVEPREFPFDCFGLVSTAKAWDQWMMEVYELFLDVNGYRYRHEKFVHVGLATSGGDTNLVKPSDPQGQDPITVKWESSLNEQGLNDGMTAIIEHGRTVIHKHVEPKAVAGNGGLIGNLLQGLQEKLFALKSQLISLTDKLKSLALVMLAK